MTLNLIATNRQEEIIKDYLENNASEMLADKINNGIKVEKDGKTLISKKNLSGFFRYATDEARKLAEKGATSAMVEDNVVYGWAMHYFEEDSITGTLYNEDGTEYKIKARKPVKEENEESIEEERELTDAPQTKAKTQPKKLEGQINLFDLLG